jgi:glycerophosphoryl diester phosphodiesterase
MSRFPLVIAHRGDSRHAPENTRAAIKLAIDAGADGVEIDLRLTADGVPVVIHDADVARTAGVRKKVADMDSAELGRIDVGSWFNARFPRRSSPSFAVETVPLLGGVLMLLATFEGLLYLELKCDSQSRQALAAAVCESIRHSPLLARIIVKSFDLDAIRQVKQVLPTVQTAALFGPDVRHLFKRRRHLIELAREHGADQLSIHRSLITRGLMNAANAADMPVTVWTVDDPRWLLRAQKLGIKALITNDPMKLLARPGPGRLAQAWD